LGGRNLPGEAKCRIVIGEVDKDGNRDYSYICIHGERERGK
jgi:hypothetical protein